MYSVIGMLSRTDGVSVEEWRTWWMERHVPKVLALPGLVDYVIYPVDEELDQVSFEYSEPTYAGVAIITFESKEAFLAAFGTPEGEADVASVNEGAPSSLVLCGEPMVMKNGLRAP